MPGWSTEQPRGRGKPGCSICSKRSQMQAVAVFQNSREHCNGGRVQSLGAQRQGGTQGWAEMVLAGISQWGDGWLRNVFWSPLLQACNSCLPVKALHVSQKQRMGKTPYQLPVWFYLQHSLLVLLCHCSKKKKKEVIIKRRLIGFSDGR